MRLHLRLGLWVGGVLLVAMASLAILMYGQARSSFVQRSSFQVETLAKTSIEQADRRARTLGEFLDALCADVHFGILLHDAERSGGAQRTLIEFLANRLTGSPLKELTAISPAGVVLGRGHQVADFGDAADTAALGALFLPPGTSMLQVRKAVTIQSRTVGYVEGGLEMNDLVDEMGRLFAGSVVLQAQSETVALPAAPGLFQVVLARPWVLAAGTVLGELVFSRTDDEGRTAFQSLILRCGALFCVAFVIVLFAIYRISNYVTRPVQQLAQAASDLARGNRDVRLPAPGRDEVGELAEAFSRMLASLEESQKKRLAAERLAAWQDAARMLAHEIKNPLSPIKTTITTLARAADEKDARLAEFVRQGAGTVLTEISHLEKLLSEFSAFARFPSPNPEPSDFNRAVRDTVAAVRETARDVKWVEDYAEGIPKAMIDAGMFAEVVRNLIRNAIEALTPAQRTIHIRTVREDGFAVVTVADSGPGVPPDKHASIFTPYFTTKQKGTGLGLAVSRKIMIEHGGDLNLLDRSPFPDAPGAAFSAKVPLAT